MTITHVVFNPVIPFVYKFYILRYPRIVFRVVMGDWIFLEQLSIHPLINLRKVISHTILKEKEFDITLEVHEKIEEGLVLFQAPGYGAFLPGIVSSYAFESQVPAVGDVSVGTLDLIDAVPVSGEDDGTADSIGLADEVFDESMIVIHV